MSAKTRYPTAKEDLHFNDQNICHFVRVKFYLTLYRLADVIAKCFLESFVNTTQSVKRRTFWQQNFTKDEPELVYICSSIRNWCNLPIMFLSRYSGPTCISTVQLTATGCVGWVSWPNQYRMLWSQCRKCLNCAVWAAADYAYLFTRHNYVVGDYGTFCRPSVCPDCPFVCYECIVAKQCEIEPRLLLIINRKSYIAFQMTWKLLTLNDPEGQWAILWLKGARLGQGWP